MLLAEAASASRTWTQYEGFYCSVYIYQALPDVTQSVIRSSRSSDVTQTLICNKFVFTGKEILFAYSHMKLKLFESLTK